MTTPAIQAIQVQHPAAGAIAISGRTRLRAAQVLQQTLQSLWEGILEVQGHNPEDGWEVVIGELHLQPGPPPGPSQGRMALPGTNGPPGG